MLLPMFAFSQKPMMKKKMEINLEMKKKKMEIEKKKKLYQNPFDMKKKVENSIINKWEEYSRAFEYSDFEKIKTYFTYPVTLSLFGNPVIVDNEKDLINWYKKIRSETQDGYKYSMLEKSKVIWISKDICMVDATYSRFNDRYERIFTGRGVYMYKKVGKAWKMFSMSGVDLNKNKK
tara:strand:- start:647 stop:1177 length:531 start_codon:yes stop_codon:yes gene_type:complete